MATLENLLAPALVERLGWTLIHFVWQATAIAVVLAVVLKALQKHHANTRYVAACVALVLIGALPLVTMMLIEVSKPIAETDPTPSPMSVQEPTPVEVVEVAELPAMQIDAQPLEIAEMTARVPWSQRAAAALEPALPYLVLGWLLGVFGLSAWHLGGWAQLQRMRRRMVCEVAAPLHARLRGLATALGIKRAVALLESALVEVPTVVGWAKPVILLPASVLSGLSADQLEAILAHELAHIRRYDYLANIAQTVIEILGFYHPALWWVSHKIRAERENCCDDLAVQVCGDSVRYARALTCLEEMRHHRSELAVAASGGSLVARIGRLLGRPATDDRRFTWLPGLIALLLVAATIIPTALVLAAPSRRQPEPSISQDTEEVAKAPPQLLLDVRTVFVFDNKALGPDTAASLRTILGADSAETNSDALRNVTANDLFHSQIANRTLPSVTAWTLLNALYEHEHLELLCNPQILAQAGQQVQMRILTEEYPLLPRPVRFPALEAKLWEIFGGTTLDLTPVVDDNDQILLKINGERADSQNDSRDKAPQSAPGKAIDHIVSARSGECVTLPVAPPTSVELPGSLYVIVTPTIIRANSDRTEYKVPEETISGPTAESKVLVPAEAQEKRGPRVLIETIFADVQADRALDRQTLGTVGDILKDQSTDLAAKENLTVGELLQSYVVRRPLPPATIEALVELLQSKGCLKTLSRPHVVALNNEQSEIRVVSEEYYALSKEPNVPPIGVEAGTSVQVTPHLSPTTPERITLEVAAKVTKAAAKPHEDGSKVPVVHTTEIASTVTVPRGHYFSFLAEPDRTADASDENSESMLILFKADRVDNAEHETGPVPPAQQNATQPRQVLLDVQIVAGERSGFKDLGIEWAFPQVSAGSFAPDGADGWPWGIEMGYTPDRDFTNALNAALRQLRDQGLARLLSNPQVAALDGRQAHITIQTKEYFSLQPQATADDPAPAAELVPITSGTVLSATPRLGDANEITLEIALEYSDTRSPRTAEELPMVTRRTTRNVVTVKDGGTVALAGLRDSQQKELVILVTASLAPESAAPPQPSTASVVLPPREPARVEAPARARKDSEPVVMSEARGNRFIHTNADGKIDREFGFEELLHSNDDRWTVTKPYMDLFGKDTRCSVAAERGQIQLETWLSQPTPGDATFSDNVVVDIIPVERDGAETCVLHADRLTYNTDKNRLSCFGPARFVCGGTEYVGRGLELYDGPAPSRPDNRFVMTIGTVNLYMTPSSSLIVTLGEGQTPSSATQARVQGTESDLSRQKTRYHIRLDFTVMKVAADKMLDQETAAQASKWLSAADGNDVSAKAWSPSDLREYPVDQLLETLHQEVPPESFKAFVDVLTSRRYVIPLFNPALVVAEGQQAEIAGGEMRLAVVAETEDRGHAVRVNAKLNLTVREPVGQANDEGVASDNGPVSVHTIQSQVTLRAENKSYALQRLAGMTMPGSNATSGDVYYLLARPVLVMPLKASEAMAPTAFERDLLKVLDEVADHTAKRIEVDETVKPQPVAADLETVGFVEVVLPRVLEDTPYAYKKMGDDVYLVYRPITAKFQGDDLPQAIQDIALKAGVTIVSDPNVSGEVYADLRDVPLEQALKILLAGSPFIVTKRPDYYLVTTRNAVEQEAVSVEARFMLLDKALMEALQRGLPIEGVTAPEDVNALHAIGADLLANETPLLGPTQVTPLLKAVQRYAGSKSLAAPRPTVLDGEPASFRLTEPLDYISGYREPNDPPGEPVPLPQSKNIGVRLNVTPKLIENDNVRMALDIEINSLLDMQTATYQGTYKYDIPVFETVTIETEVVIPDGHTVMIRGGEIRSLHGTQPSKDQPDRHLIILIKPQKTEISPVPSAPSMSNEMDFGQGGMMGGMMGGMGAFRPETAPRPKN